MSKFFNKSDQRGTLLIEALAMLGLIAMVTPTLYKKSAERLQEIQDINSASQARTMSSVMDAFIRQNFSGLMSSMSDVMHSTIVIDFEDGQAGAYRIGYSSYLPYGYTPNEIRGYDMPKVYVHRDNSTLVSYILYPKIVDIGNKRAARMASLVGANGGVITDNKEAKGTGGAWYLNSSMIEDMNLDESSLTENSLMVTSSEPISMSYDDSAKYLYRVPPQPDTDDASYYHNTMITDLYMGGHPFDDTDYSRYASDYYSIFNVKKLTMNTDCNRGYISEKNSTSPQGFCDPNVADLYIGKPFTTVGNHGTLDTAAHSPRVEGNNGAAWIYGNLAALSESFQLFREDALYDGNVKENTGYDAEMERTADGWDVLQFARMNSSGTGDEEVVVFRAENKENAERVAMMDEFVQIRRREDSSDIVDFLVGESSGIGGPGALITAFSANNLNEVHINQNSVSSLTEINRQGGTVYINGGSTTTTNMATYINDMGGNLYAGHDGGWMIAQGADNSARVHLLANVNSTGTDNRIFTVGHSIDKDTGAIGTAYDSNHMIYADTDKVSLRGGAIRVYSGLGYSDEGIESGPVAFQPTNNNAIKNDYTDLAGTTSDHLTTIASRYTDIIGRTYMGNKNMSSTASNDGTYTRKEFTLGVAGSAWVDELLWARRAWLKQAGMQELHAGFESYSQFVSAPQNAWLNAYDDMVVVRNSDKIASGSSKGQIFGANSDVMFYTDSTLAYMGDTEGAWSAFENGSARIGAGDQSNGALKNYFLADTVGGDGSANVVGSTLVNLYTLNDSVSSVVDIQREAMRFGGHWSSSYANRIDAKTGTFTIKTKDVSSTDEDEGAQFYADADKIRTRWVDFQVEDDSSTVRFKVAPNSEPESKTDEANVQVNGSFHVTGNEVIHIASNSSNAVGTDDNDHAMFEIDPDYIQVWAKDTDGNYAPGGSAPDGYYAMLKINPTDVQGGSSAIDDTRDASIYIRKGAIELEESYSNSGSASTYAADEGFGYIKANRFVSNTNEVVPEIAGKTDRGTMYDQYMVNPAYTSVMHDIKLTTRGGARLSDILPDFILKGVYNVSNDFIEGSKTKRISWSCGSNCSAQGYDPQPDKVAWADPYVGRIPYALCPPGYKNMATLIPISFNMGQAGEIIQADKFASYKSEATGDKTDTSQRWYVNPASRQAAILETAQTMQGVTDMNDAIIYPGMEEVSSLIYNGIYQDENSHTSFISQTLSRTEGWYLGLKAYYTDEAGTATDSYLKADSSATGTQNLHSYTYSKDGSDKYAVAQPLYFQQNTWLKTALQPFEEGWYGRLGFIYDKDYYHLGDGAGSEGMYSNNNQEGHNDIDNMNPMFDGNFAWNLFPVPTNTLEGHATVYCYFDRTEFNSANWSDKVDQIDQLGSYRNPESKDSGTNAGYLNRLHDPSLKYSDPW